MNTIVSCAKRLMFLTAFLNCALRHAASIFPLICLLVTTLLPQAAYAVSNGVVISQVYGGGGNAGAPVRNDFFELFNRGTAPVSLAGWSIQYAPVGSVAWVVVPLSGTLNAGQYFLVQMGSGGAAGVLLPTADASNATNISALAGKVALVSSATALALANPLALPQVIDFVGYGITADAFETTAAPAPSNTQGDIRKSVGCTETDNNSADFSLGVPSARNKTTAVSPCSPVADLAITKNVDKAAASQGDALIYTLKISNTLGPNAANGAVVKDTLPTNFSAGAITCAFTGLATCPASITTANLATGVTIPALPVGGSITITIPGTISGSTNLSNSATVATPTGVSDPIPGDNTSATVLTMVTVLLPPSLSVTKAVSANPLIVGTAGQSYSVVIKNNGGVATTAPIAITDTLPTGITTSGVITATGGTLSGCPASGAANLTGCQIAAGIAPTASVTINVPVIVAAIAVGASGGNNFATATGGGDPNCPAVSPAASCSASTPTVAVLAPANLTTVKKIITVNGAAATPATVVKAGDTIVYDITTTNSGGVAGNTTLTEIVPGNSTYALTTEGWSTAPACAAAGTTCNQLVAVPGNSSVSKTFTIKVDASLPITATSIANVVTSSADVVCAACAPAANPIQAAAITTVKKLTLISGAVAATGATVKAGDTLTYDITSTNANGTAGSTTLTETVPANTTYSLTTEGWSTTPACANAGTSCSQLVAVAGNASVSKTFTVKVDASLPASATSIANVVTSSTDPACAGCAPAANPIAPASIATIKKLSLINGVAAAAGAIVKADDMLTYDITSTNSSGTAGSTMLTEKVPLNTTYNLTTEGWSATCVAATSSCTQTVNVAGNSSVTKTFTVKVDASLPASATNVANVVTSSADVTCAACAPAANPVAPALITSVKKLALINGVAAAAGATVKAGDTLTYDITSTNTSGTSGATTLTESVPLDTTYSLTTEGWSTAPACGAAGTSCNQVVNVASNSSVSKTFTVKIDSSLPATATSIGNVVTSSADVTCAACAPVANPIAPASIATVKKLSLINGVAAAAGATVKADDTLTYDITSTNSSGTAGSTTLTEKVPLNTTYNLTTEGWSPTCAAASSSCTQLVNVAGNSSVSKTFTVKVDASLPAATTSIANVVSSSADSTCAACAPVANPIAPANITTTKKLHLINGLSVSAGMVVKAGDTLTYDITSTNASGTAGATTLTEKVPLNTTYSLTTEGWSTAPTCAAADSTCTQLVNVAGNSSVSKTFTVNVDASLSATATSIANAVTSSADAACSACAPAANPIAPAVTITKTVSANPLVVGALGQFYTITVKNTVGTPTSAAISVNDILPTGITISGPITASGGTLSGCPAGGTNLTGCSIAGGVAVGASVVLTVPISVAGNAMGAGTGTNTATIFGGGDLICTVATPCAATTPVTDVKAQRIDIAKSVDAPVQTAPLTFQIPYTLVVKNTGTIPATNVQVNDDLSATFSNGTPVISMSTPAAVSGGTCAINPIVFNGTTNSRMLTGTDNLPADASCIINFTVELAYPNVSAIPTSAQNNTAIATTYAAPPAVAGGVPTGGTLVADNSTNGNTPVVGDTPSATPVTLFAGKIDAVKSAGAPKNTAANSFEIPYAVVIGNVGSNSATAYNVQANDNLAAAFPSATSVKVKAGSYSVTPAACTPNSAFNGVADTRLLAGTNNLVSGQSCIIRFTAEAVFAAGQVPTVAQNNSAFASVTPTGSGANPGYANGQPPANAVATDISNTGPSLPATAIPGTAAVIPGLPAVAGGDNSSGTPTSVVLKINPGKISGSVWDDAANGNKIKEPGEAGVAGWTVEMIDPVTRLPVTGTDGQPARATTGADGSYSIANIPPGKWSLQFRAPGANAQGAVFGVPSNGEQANGGSAQSIPNPITRSLDIDVAPGVTIPQQSLPLDPSGVVYDSATRSPIGGATVTLIGPDGQPVPANLLLPNQQDQSTLALGPSAGGYRFDLLPGAPAGNYTIKITPPVGYANVSSVLPPQSGSYTPPALPGAPVSLGSGKAPQGSGSTNYYLVFNLTPGISRDVVHNNIPLDSTDSGSLFIRKEVNRASVEIGDALTYRITVRSTRLAGPGNIVDRLPVGFKLIPNTTKMGKTANTLVAAADPAGTPGPALTFSVSLPVNQDVVIEYKVRVSIGSERGDGINRAQAQLGVLRSLEAQAKVKVSGGVFSRDACVIGKVFVDCNQNMQQDAGEPGIPSVRLYLEDGTNITTDENGQYSICGLRPITHVLKIDSSTMPIGSRMGITSSRNAGDADSLFVDLKAHELYRADFIEQSCLPKVLEQVNQRRKLGPVLVPQQHDQGKDEKWSIQYNSEQHKLDSTPSVNEGGRQ